MSSVLTAPTRQPASGTRLLTPRAAFALQLSVVVSLLAGSIAPTPLYARYQAEWGFGTETVTVVFGVYALAVLGALLVVGRLSDHVGRRPVLLAALAIQLVVMALFVVAGSVEVLLGARVLQGLSTGAALAAVGAGLLDLDRVRGASANAVAAPLGTATGALGAGLLVAFAPDPTHLVFLLLSVVFVVQLAGLSRMGETVTPTEGARASLRPRLATPPAVRRPLLAAIPALVAAWSLAGFYGSLGPALVARLVGDASVVLGALAMVSLAGVGALSVRLERNTVPSLAMRRGTALLVAGVGVTVVAVALGSAPVFFLGTAIAGAGFGGALSGAMRSVTGLAAPHERAGVVSVLFIASYLAMGVPAIVAGVVVAHTGDLIGTSRGLGLAAMALAALAFVAETRRTA